MTDRPAKPKDMTWVSPYLVVTDIEPCLEFYRKAFGFETRATLTNDRGVIVHAEIVYRDSVLMLGLESHDKNSSSPKTHSGTSVSFYIYTEEIDDFFLSAKKAGAEVIEEPTAQYWGDRTCTFKCPEGHLWVFAQNVADFDSAVAPGA